MTRKTSFLEFWRSRKERAAYLHKAKSLRLLPSQLKQLQDDGAVRAALKNCRLASLLPPVGTDFLRPFTSASLEQMSQRKKEEEEQRGKKKEQKVKNDDLPKPSTDLEEGKPLPFLFGDPSQAHLNTPLEELDPYHQSETFLVLGKGKVIHRFNAHKACYLFSPVNPLRTLAIKILTSSFFSSLIFVTLLVNFVFLVGLSGFSFVNRNVELVFTAIYLLEVLVKIVSRGFCIGKFTFLRNPWDWPDVIIIAAALLLLFVYFPALKTVALIWKVLPIFPGLKKMVSSFVHSVKRLSCVLALTFFLLCVFATISLQVFMGSLSQKCVSLPARDHNLTSDDFFSHYYDDQSSDFNFHEHISNANNSYFPPGGRDALVCGNSSDAGVCPEGFTCLWSKKNPNYGYTSYSSFGWSLLSTFRLLSQDYWDNLMQLVLRANGRSNFIYFMFVSSPGCFLLVSLIIAVTAAALCELERSRLAEASRKEKEFNQILKALKRSEEEEAGKSEGHHDNSKKSPESQQASEGGVGAQGSCSPCCHAAAQLLLTWNCCGCWRGLKRWLHAVVTHPCFDLGIVLCLILNIIFSAMEHFPLTAQLAQTLTTAELVFTFIFIAEMLVKILALDPYNYFKVGWNIYESIIVVISVLELMLDNISGLSVLMRYYRLARWWHSFQVFLRITLKYSFLLLLVFLGFVTVGFQLFQDNYNTFVCRISEDCQLPRWHMASFFHTFLSFFRMLCGSWIEILWDCMEVSGPAMCLTFILSVVIIGNLLILHLFLVLLLNPYSSDLREERKKNNLEIAFGWCKTWILENICTSLGKKDSNKSDQTAANGQGQNKDYVSLDLVTSDETKVKTPDEERPKRADEQKDSEVGRVQADGDQVEEAPESCCCQSCYRCCPCLDVDTSQGAGRCCFNCRKGVLSVIQSKFFKFFINFIVVLSSVSLALEDIYITHREGVMVVVGISGLVFLLLFFIEMILKWIGFGFRKYFINAWCCLEFIIVNVFILVYITGNLGTLRVLIVVRILSFFQGPRLVVRTLLRMIPSLFEGMLVLQLAWLIFSVAGVQMFAGKFYYCFNETSEEIFHVEHISNKSECFYVMEADYNEVRWKNAAFNYDSVMMGYLSLFILGFSKGWFDIMYSAVDSRLVEDQPIYENNSYLWIYFVLFIINVFFSINFFIKVILTDLQFRDKPGFMTEHQQKHSRVLMKLFPKSPQRAVPRPQNKCLAGLFDLMNSSWYELVMVVLICLNVVVLMVESTDDSVRKSNVLFFMQFAFILLFLLEFIFKVIAFRQHYFKDGWNIIDFVVLLIQIAGVFILDYMWYYVFNPSLLVFLRLFRICRVLHVIPFTRRIRKLLLAFVKSLPALFNIAFVLLIVMVIFSLIGMFNFAHVKKGAGIDDLYNFETFCSSMVCLFMTSTTADWPGLLLPIMSSPPDCDPFMEHPGTYVVGDCGSPTLGIVFFTTYITLSFLILIQLYITVVMEIINSEGTEALCDDDLQNFCKTWMKFDPDGTHLIPYSKLSEFSDSLQDPLRIPKPNTTKLVHMDLPLYPGDKVHCMDVLQSLAKQVLDDAEEVNSLKAKMEKQFKAKQVWDEPISSTLRRKQEDVAAKVIQRAFRKGRDTLEKEKPAAEVSDSSPLEGATE